MRTYLPTLYSYIQCENPDVFYNRFAYRNQYGHYEYERNTIQTVLRHLRNAVCQDKLSIHPLSGAQNQEVTHIVFRDTNEYTETNLLFEEFYIKIDVNDLFSVLSELVVFYERIADDTPNIN